MGKKAKKNPNESKKKRVVKFIGRPTRFKKAERFSSTSSRRTTSPWGK